MISADTITQSFIKWSIVQTVVWLLLVVQPAGSAQYVPDSALSPNITRNANIVPTGENNAVCVSNTGTPTPAIVLCSTLDLTGKTVLFKLPEVTIANLPANHALSIVTNGSAGDDCTKGGGTTRVLCAWNGAAWASIGGGTGTGTGDVTDVLQTNNEVCVANPGGPQPQVSLCPTVVTTGKTVQLGRVDLAGEIRPTTLAAQADDWNPTNLATSNSIYVNTTGAQSISGLSGGALGRILTIHYIGTTALTLLNESSSSLVSNRFSLGANLVLNPNQSVLIQYDSTVSRWRMIGGIGATDNYCADQGGSDAYACNLLPTITSYVTGRHYFFKANTANTGPATIAFNGQAALPIKKAVGGVTTDLATNDIRVGQVVEVVYDGTNMQMLSMLGNSPTGIGGLATNTVPRAASATTLQDSAIVDDGSTVTISRSTTYGDCSTNCITENRSAITGQQTYTYPNHTGTLAIYPNARKSLQIELFSADTNVTSGTGVVYFRVPSNLNGMNLVGVASNLVTAGTTGLNSVQITRCAAVATSPLCSGTTASMLSTVLSIDSGETSSSTASTAAVIDTSNDNVTTAEILRFDVTETSGTPAKGLIVSLEFELP